MAKLTQRHATAVALAPSVNPYYPIGGTTPSDRPHLLPSVSISFNENNANDKALTLRLVQADTQGTSGTDLDPSYDDTRVTATVPDGQTNMSGTTTAVPNGNVKTLFGPFFLHPSAQTFNLDLRDQDGNPVFVPANKTWAWEVLNPSTNASTPNILIEQRIED